MSRTMPIVVILFLSCVALGPALGPVHAQQPACLPGDAFENDDVRIWFHAQKGFVKVFRKDNETGANIGQYQYKTGALEEVAGNATLASMNLERAFPQTSDCRIQDDGETVTLELTVKDDVKSDGGDVGEATVTFVYRFNKTSDGAKFDLHVDDWPWQGNTSILSYVFHVAIDDGTVEPAENGVGFRDGDGQAVGSIEWAPNATAYYDDEHEETAIVESHTQVGDDNSSANVRLDFTNVTAGYNRFVYDPWVGTGWYVVIGGILVSASVLPAPVRKIVDPVVRRVL